MHPSRLVCSQGMSYIFEPIYNILLTKRAKEIKLGRLLDESANSAVAYEQDSQRNRSNPNNRARIPSNTDLRVDERTFEVWISEDEDEDNNDSTVHKRRKLNHDTRIIDDESHRNDTVRRQRHIEPAQLEDEIESIRRDFRDTIDGYEPRPLVLTSDKDAGRGYFSNNIRSTANIKRSRRLRFTNQINHSYTVINSLLHICMLRSDWKNALQLFSVIIRTYMCDVKQCWSIGLEILNKMNEEEFLKLLKDEGHEPLSGEKLQLAAASRSIALERIFEHDDESYKAITRMIALGNTKRPFRARIMRFLQFMTNTYKVNRPNFHIAKYPYQVYCPKDEMTRYLTLASHSHAAYRGGTTDFVPFYVYSLLSELMLGGRFKQFEELCEELQLRAPYHDDPMVRYMSAMNSYLECVSLYCRLCQEYGSILQIIDDMQSQDTKTVDKELIISKIADCKTRFHELEKFPKFKVDLDKIDKDLGYFSGLVINTQKSETVDRAVASDIGKHDTEASNTEASDAEASDTEANNSDTDTSGSSDFFREDEDNVAMLEEQQAEEDGDRDYQHDEPT
ncbi:hypothetical protein FOA43_003743 [Brettanomyces nanus]|uniref:Uncharacterized protein n=1 Tax=Eeniella nana TaxID=13502 RepID=A0A875S7W6_EENNA|nr:uncharacterized protein FOA43_003743 [Brettanomyces nanus]QPG76355.1 hypothetical protein FOA43_003743 [Brettanomyces nanus]